MVAAGIGIATAAFLASVAGGAGVRSSRFRTGRHLVVAVAMGAGLDQLAVGGEGRCRCLGDPRGKCWKRGSGHKQ